jgi:signal peptidase I
MWIIEILKFLIRPFTVVFDLIAEYNFLPTISRIEEEIEVQQLQIDLNGMTDERNAIMIDLTKQYIDRVYIENGDSYQFKDRIIEPKIWRLVKVKLRDKYAKEIRHAV